MTGERITQKRSFSADHLKIRATGVRVQAAFDTETGQLVGAQLARDGHEAGKREEAREHRERRDHEERDEHRADDD